METYEIRVLTKQHAQGGIYSSSHADGHAAVSRALALASSLEAVVEVWCGSRCVYAGQLGQVSFSI